MSKWLHKVADPYKQPSIGVDTASGASGYKRQWKAVECAVTIVFRRSYST